MPEEAEMQEKIFVIGGAMIRETEICYPGYLAPALSFVVNGKAYLLIYQTIYLFSPGNKREDG